MKKKKFGLKKIIALIILIIGIVTAIPFISSIIFQCVEVESLKEFNAINGITIPLFNELKICESMDFFFVYNLSEVGNKSCQTLRYKEEIDHFHLTKDGETCEEYMKTQYCFKRIQVNNSEKLSITYKKCDRWSKIKYTLFQLKNEN